MAGSLRTSVPARFAIAIMAPDPDTGPFSSGIPASICMGLARISASDVPGAVIHGTEKLAVVNLWACNALRWDLVSEKPKT